MTTHLDKVHHITTIALVIADLDQEDDWLRDVPNEMEIEDGSSRSMVREDGISAFSDFGIENLIDLVRMQYSISAPSTLDAYSQ
ncbi:hypothetical protein ACT4MK_02795 [Bradyrhizobium barranii]|uniref:hypothetical protein n=1 Tax=Bradyrhizobium TaxID=374 RepID=UPI003F214EAA